MKTLLSILIILVFINCGCATYKQLSLPELKFYETHGSFSTLWYCGSDDDFHFFMHLDKQREKFKLNKEELELPYTVPTSTLDEYILVTKIKGNKIELEK